jgi:hypothetical protein
MARKGASHLGFLALLTATRARVSVPPLRSAGVALCELAISAHKPGSITNATQEAERGRVSRMAGLS